MFEDDGTPIEGATITAIYFDERFKNLAPYAVGVAKADATGAYRLTDLRDGQYLLCVAAAPEAAADLVRPCDWGLAGERLRLLSGVAATGIDRAIPRGGRSGRAFGQEREGGDGGAFVGGGLGTGRVVPHRAGDEER